MKNKRSWIITLAGACLLSLGAGAWSKEAIASNAQTEPTLWEGFAINATAVRTEDPSGLRFRTVAEHLTDSMKADNPDAEYYTTLTFTTSGGKSYTSNVPATVWRAENDGWNTVLLDIPESDYATEITAQSFIVFDDVTYKTEAVTTSIAKTAAGAIAYGATNEKLNEYVKNAVTQITLDQTSANVAVSHTTKLMATTAPVNCRVKWTTDNAAVATVDVDGNVKGISQGTAIITAQMNNVTASCQVTVSERPTVIANFDDEQAAALISHNASSTSFATGASNASGDYSWQLKSSMNKAMQVAFVGTKLDELFANTAIDGFTFDIKTSKNSAATTTDGLLNATYTTSWSNVAFTRGTYDLWKVSGASNFTFDFPAAGFLTSLSVYLDNFEYIYDDGEQASVQLTDEEISQLDGYMPSYVAEETFEFFAYNSLTDGSWTEYDENGNAIIHEGVEDFRNVNRIKEYKDAGMTILMPQSACAIASDDEDFTFSSSKLRWVMDMSTEAGMNKVIVADYRLYKLIEDMQQGTLQFASTAELDAKVVGYMHDYAQHEAFYGVMFPDEPTYTLLSGYGYGDVYKSIKRCFPDAHVQCNLFPPDDGLTSSGKLPTPTSEQIAAYTAMGYDETHATRFASFALYLNTFIDVTGANYIMYDAYPLTDDGINEGYVAGMQVAANVAAQRGVRLHFVSQTMTMQTSANADNDRALTEADLRWLNNMQLGLGVKQLAYFTYFTRNNSEAETFIDGGSFINRDGSKTPLYYTMREILAENQAFASTIMNFDYTTSATYTGGYSANGTSQANTCVNGSFAKVQSVTVSKESALISELYDKAYGRYMYMVQNLADTRCSALATSQTVKLTFNENYQYAIVWKNGERSVVKLENNAYVVKQSASAAVYVIPFNKATEQDRFVHDNSSGDNGAWFPGSTGGDSKFDSVCLDFLEDETEREVGVYFPGSSIGTSPWE